MLHLIYRELSGARFEPLCMIINAANDLIYFRHIWRLLRLLEDTTDIIFISLSIIIIAFALFLSDNIGYLRTVRETYYL